MRTNEIMPIKCIHKSKQLLHSIILELDNKKAVIETQPTEHRYPQKITEQSNQGS